MSKSKSQVLARTCEWMIIVILLFVALRCVPCVSGNANHIVRMPEVNHIRRFGFFVYRKLTVIVIRNSGGVCTSHGCILGEQIGEVTQITYLLTAIITNVCHELRRGYAVY